MRIAGLILIGLCAISWGQQVSSTTWGNRWSMVDNRPHTLSEIQTNIVEYQFPIGRYNISPFIGFETGWPNLSLQSPHLIGGILFQYKF